MVACEATDLDTRGRRAASGPRFGCALARQIEIYTGTAPQIIEGFRFRPAQPPLLGVGSGFLGCGIQLTKQLPHQAPALSLATDYAHRFRC